MTIDERIQALTMNLELVSHDIETLRDGMGTMRDGMETLRDMARQDGENIHALARIAEIRERRLTDLEE